MLLRPALRNGWWLIVLALMAAACTDDGPDSGVPAGETGEEPATALEVTAQLDSGHSLRGEVRFTTDTEVPPAIILRRDDGAAVRIVAEEATLGEHVVPLLELRSGAEYTIEVEAGVATGSTTLTTGVLPSDMPPLEVLSDPERMTAGLTLFNAIPFTPGAEEQAASDDGYILAVDAEGEVVWYYRQTHSVQDVQRTEDGHLIFIHHETGVRRLDPASGLVAEWSGTTGLDEAPSDGHGRRYAGDDAVRVESDQMHHEVVELPNGNLMTLSRELRIIEGFPEPLCDDDEENFDGSYQVVTDTVVEFQPDDGQVVAEWSLFDMVDPLDDLERIKPGEFCSQYLSDVYPDLPARDWTHANAVVLDEERNLLLVSVRHLDKLMAIRYSDDEFGPAGELVWSLGEGGDFTLEEGEWFLHPHAPEVLEDGSIMIYDNGNERPGTSLDDPDRLPYSRAVLYAIDTEALTATQVWEHRADSPGDAVYAPFVGDTDMLEEGTVLITHGGLIDPPAHSPQTEGALVWGRIIEAEYETGEIVFDLAMKDPEGETGWIIYRAERLETLYPAGFTVEPLEDPDDLDE